MSAESDLRLSFYKTISTINAEHDITLVRNIDDGSFYVKKIVTNYNKEIYSMLATNEFPHLPRIKELIYTENSLVIIEEKIEGQTLSVILEKGPLSEKETRKIVKQLCDILMPLHNHHPMIIHRDIKPSNMILDPYGDLYLIDFDASKYYDPGKTRDTTLIGTVNYAAPEQYGFSQSNERTDIYSIGVLMNKMLTGRFPNECLYQGGLTPVITRCLKMEPGKRYTSVTALSKAVKSEWEPTYQKSSSKSKLSFFKNPLYSPHSHLIPGFRTGKVWKMIVATLSYICFLCLTFESTSTDTNGVDYKGADLIFFKIAFFIIIFGWTFYLSNYMGWRDVFPFKKSKNIVVNIFRITLGCFLIMLAAAIFFVIFTS